jgi:hypothetical protein
MTKYMRTAALAAAVLIGCVSCGDVVRSSRSPVLVTVTNLTPAVLLSDVIRNVTAPSPCSPTSPCPTVFSDNATATITAAMKDVGIAPTTNNQITINRYHVDFRRADGRSIEGVDVPRAFDGAVTASIPANGSASVPFELVRHLSKSESPLVQLINSSNVIATIAVVTFYGTDAVGNEVAAVGQVTVNFGNFGDQ